MSQSTEPSEKRRPAVFLDRDGVLNRDRGRQYVLAPDQLDLFPEALQAAPLLASSAFRVVVVTNQSAVARGLLDEQVLRNVHHELARQWLAAGGRLDGIYYCPHRDEDDCTCRKPQPGMLHRAATDLNIDLAGSYLIGDSVRDLQAAVRAGVQPLLVRTGHGEQHQNQLAGTPLEATPVFPHVRGAVEWILAHRKSEVDASDQLNR